MSCAGCTALDSAGIIWAQHPSENKNKNKKIHRDWCVITTTRDSGKCSAKITQSGTFREVSSEYIIQLNGSKERKQNFKRKQQKTRDILL